MSVDTSDIDTQIATLQAEKAKKLAIAEREARRKEMEENKVLVASTPGKKQSRDDRPLGDKPAQPKFEIQSVGRTKRPPQVLPSLSPAGPSRMPSSLTALRRQQPSFSSAPTRPEVPRSSSFADRPLPPYGATKEEDQPDSARAVGPAGAAEEEDEELEVDEPGVQRDQDGLAIIEKLRPGPRDFGKDPEGEGVWAFVEPNSGIRLSKRLLAHSAVQAHFSGRYFLPPSLLYSVIRLSRYGATYDVPVEGDWVTIAVVAERGEVKVSGSKAGDESDASEEEDGTPRRGPQQGKDKGTGKSKDATKKGAEGKAKKRGPRKYINLKLTSLPPRSNDRASSTQGDALLQLLLFEADAVVRSEPDEEGEVKRSYRGGSGGAYEKWCNLGVGSVIALLNPRLLRPLRAGAGAPHPLTLPLALNPTSAEGITLIGQSRDLGCCSAQQKDGNRCRTWVDLRQSAVCEYHIHAAVQRSRSSRAEFTASTSSYGFPRGGTFATPPFPGARLSANHHQKTGLLSSSGPHVAPRGVENGGGGATYVVGSGLVRTGGRERTPGGFKGFGEEHVGEKLGRGRAERKKRQREEREAEEALRRMVDKGSTGGKYLAVIERHRAKDAAGDDKGGIKDRKGGEDEREVESKRPFSADTIKRIGFDPTRIAGRENEAGKRRKAESIAILKEPGRGFEGTKRVKRGSMRTPSGGLRKDEGEDAGGPKALGSPGPADRLVDLD